MSWINATEGENSGEFHLFTEVHNMMWVCSNADCRYCRLLKSVTPLNCPSRSEYLLPLNPYIPSIYSLTRLKRNCFNLIGSVDFLLDVHLRSRHQ